jgi:hypothetical protein
MVGVSCGEIPTTTYGKLINEGHLKYIPSPMEKCHNIVAKLELKGNLYMLFCKSCKLYVITFGKLKINLEPLKYL